MGRDVEPYMVVGVLIMLIYNSHECALIYIQVVFAESDVVDSYGSAVRNKKNAKTFLHETHGSRGNRLGAHLDPQLKKRWW